MKEFEVTITETLQKSVPLEAATREEAQAMSYKALRMTSTRRYYGKMQLVTILRNPILIGNNALKLYFGEMHIFTLSRYNKLRDIDADFGCVYNIITGNCNYLHFLGVRSVRLWNKSGETCI